MKKTNFFSHDSNARNDEKIINLRMALGAEGYGIYFMLLERLREDARYMSIKDYNMLAFDLRVDAGKVKRVVEDFGLFVFTTIDGSEYIYSESFMRRMEIKDDSKKARSEAGKKGAEVRWNKESDGNAIKNNGNAMAMPLKNIASKVKESKVKESKEKNKGDFSIFESVWSLYPHKKGKSAVSKKSKEAIQKLGLDAITNAVMHYKQDVENQRANGFTSLNYMQGSTFFNGRYTDYLDPSSVTPLKAIPAKNTNTPSGQYKSGTEKTREVLERMMQDAEQF